jgi:TatD DNase family protein
VHLIDTHIHLYAEEFEGQQDQLIREAMSVGVQQFILPNIDHTSLDGLHTLADKYPGVCIPMMGLHPCYVKEGYEKELQQVEKLLRSGNYKAVGEIGLDKFWDLTFVEQQKQALRIQLNLAHELNLPVALHTRNANADTIALVRAMNLPGLRGVFHCVSGTLQEAQEMIDLGFYLGIGGVLTFKNSGLDKIVMDLPMERIVLETDGPYLAPAPHRGKRNDPSYLRLVADKLAEIKNLSIGEVAEITSANARKLFAL